MDNKEPLAVATVTNTYGLAIYEITSDEVLVGVDEEEPVWMDIEYDGQGLPYINCYGETYLDEFIKVNKGEQ